MMKAGKKSKFLVMAGTLSAQFLAGCSPQPAQEEQAPKGQSYSAVSAFSAKAPCCDLSESRDGVYQADSSPDEFKGIGRISVSIKDHKITGVAFQGIDGKGEIKGENYGKTNGEIENPVFYQKAQLAVKANSIYAEQLLEVQELEKVDAVSGATVSYRQFTEAAKKAIALSKA